MADDSESLGSLYVEITGDFSELSEAIDQATQDATQGAEQIANALNNVSAGRNIGEQFSGLGDSLGNIDLGSLGETASDSNAGLEELAATLEQTASSGEDIDSTLSDLSDSLNEVGSSATEATAGLDDIDTSAGDAVDSLDEVSSTADDLGSNFEQIGDSAQNAGDSLESFAGDTAEANEGAQEAEGSLSDLAEQLAAVGEALVITEALTEFANEAESAADKVTTATIALTAITGSADTAKETLEGLEELGTADGLAMPSLLTAATRMQQMLGPGADVTSLLGEIANGAAVMGTDINTAATRFDQMAVAGTANARSLTSLGLNLQTLSDAINQVTGTVGTMDTTAAAAFKALDQTQRIQVLQVAMQGLAGTATQVAQQTFGAQWQILANQWETVMVEAGQALLPIVSEMNNLLKTDILPFIQTLAADFNALPAPIKDTVVAVSLLAVGVAAGTVALGGMAAAFGALSGLAGASVEALTTLGLVSEATGAAEGEEAAAAAAQAAAHGSAAAAMGAEAIAAEGAAVATAGGAAAAEEGTAAFSAFGLTLGPVAIGIAGVAAGILALKFSGVAAQIQELGSAIASTSGFWSELATDAKVALEEIALDFLDAEGAFISWYDGLTNSASALKILIPVLDTFSSSLPSASTVLERFGEQLLASGIPLADMTAAFKTLAGDTPQMNTAMQGLLQSLTPLPPAFATTATGTDNMSAGLAALVTKQQAANLALQQAKQNLADATEALQNGQITQNVYNLALNNYNTALKTASESGANFSSTLAGIQQKLSDAQISFNTAVGALTQIANTAPTSANGIALLADAYTKAESAAKAAGVAFANAQGIIAQQTILNNQNVASLDAYTAVLNNYFAQLASGNLTAEQQEQITQNIITTYAKAQQAATAVGQSYYNENAAILSLNENAGKQVTTLNEVSNTYTTLAGLGTQTATQQAALGNAFKTVQTDAAALGLSVTQVGNGLVFTVTNTNTATPAMQALATQLTQANTQGMDMVNVNGKLVPTMASLSAATSGAASNLVKYVQTADGGTVAIYGLVTATNQHTSAMQNNASAAQQAKQAQIDLGSTYQTVAAEILNLTNGGKNQVTNLENLVGAFVDLDSTAQTTVAGQVALQNAFKNAQQAGAALGITITSTGASAANTATPAVQALAQQINDAIQQMNAGSSAGNNLVSTLNNIGSAANSAASDMQSFASAEGDWIQQDSGWMGNEGGPQSALQVVAQGAAEALSPLTAGLTIGFNQTQAAQAFANESGGFAQVGNAQALPQSPGPGYYWDGTKWVETAAESSAQSYAGSNIEASSTSSAASATSALATAATSAATATGNLSTAATTATNSGVTPLGNAAVTAASSGVTPLGNAAVTAATAISGSGGLSDAVTATIPVMETYASQLGTTSVTAAQLEQGTGDLTDQQQKYYEAVATSLNAQDAYTEALNAGTDSQAQLTQLLAASYNAQAAVQDLTGTAQVASDTAAQLSTQLGTTTVTAAQLEVGTGDLTAQQQKYYGAVADSINAQNAYSNALQSGTATAAQLQQLLTASFAAQATVQDLSGGANVGNLDTSSTGPLAGPTTPAPTAPPSGLTGPAANGSWVWDYVSQKWVWQPQASGGNVGGSSNFAGPGSTSAYTPTILSATGTPLTQAAGPTSLTVNVNAGTVVGQNAAQALVNLVMPQMVAQLRQAGVKI